MGDRQLLGPNLLLFHWFQRGRISKQFKMCPKPLATARKLEEGQVRKLSGHRLALSNSKPGPHQRLALFGESLLEALSSPHFFMAFSALLYGQHGLFSALSSLERSNCSSRYAFLLSSHRSNGVVELVHHSNFKRSTAALLAARV